MKVYIEFLQEDNHLVREIIHNVEKVVQKSRNYTFVFEKTDGKVVEHSYTNDSIFNISIDE